MDFYLGVPMPGWMGLAPMRNTPMMISHNRLVRYSVLPRADADSPWMLDSGGFTQLQRHGGWDGDFRKYARRARNYAWHIGHMHFAAPQDWMCEPAIRHGGTFNGQHFVGTGLSVAEHQARTVGNYLDLMSYEPGVPWMPVLQGYTLAEYLRCAELYEQAGVRLAELPRVGLGSVCRRQNTDEIEEIVTALAQLGLRLHGFGVKTLGLARYADKLASADSMAWSKRGTKVPGCDRLTPGTTQTHKTESNCIHFAADWRRDLLAKLDLAKAA